ncbi:MAG: ABC transporter permease [Bacteroidetes bacterium]|nr:ABC transporter permease [Bacteroidota bacterium]
MFFNYFKTAWRNLRKTRSNSIINIAGLSIGMSVVILIGLWIHDELTFDTYHKNYNRIAKVLQNVTNNGGVQTWSSVPFPLADELRKNYGGDFKHIVMAAQWNDHLLSVDDKKLMEEGVFFEKEAPEMLTLNMIKGAWDGLKDPSSILLSASTAKAYFGDVDPMNKMMKIDNSIDVKVTGVYEDLPRNTSFGSLHFISTWDIIYSKMDWVRNISDPWRPNSFTLFVQINDNADFDKASLRIKDAKLKRVNEQLAKKKPQLFLAPMSRWHLYSQYKDGVNIGGGIQYVWMFGIIGIFVLLLACINFMNLSTARSEKRAKEVGIRKTVGSSRKQLILQFFSESLLTVLFALAFSLIIVQFSLPFFNQVADKQMSILWSNPFFWLIAVGFSIITGVIAGSYPAFYLSSFKPVKVLKGTFKAGRFASLPRKLSVILQFTVSVTLIIGTIIVYRQIQFAKNRPIGYSREGLVAVSHGTDDIHKHFNAVKEELVNSGAIVSMAESQSPTTAIYSSTSGLDWAGKDPNLSIDFKNILVSYDYGKTIGWEFKEGRDFSKEFATDSSAVILNEAAANFIGFKKPIGETIRWWGTPLKVIGIAKNMIMENPFESAKPTIFVASNDPMNITILKINPKSSAKDALNKIESVFKKFNPSELFQYNFVDEEYAKKFGNEERIGTLAGFFAILAVAISCLGLFGLASFIAEQRTKEIGVRKVLGASVFSVWNLLSKDFAMLVLISLFISIPISYYFMHQWLQNYEFRTNISWWIFVAAGSGAVLITILVVSFQTVKAAVSNPLKSLRTE